MVNAPATQTIRCDVAEMWLSCGSLLRIPTLLHGATRATLSSAGWSPIQFRGEAAPPWTGDGLWTRRDPQPPTNRCVRRAALLPEDRRWLSDVRTARSGSGRCWTPPPLTQNYLCRPLKASWLEPVTFIGIISISGGSGTVEGMRNISLYKYIYI